MTRFFSTLLVLLYFTSSGQTLPRGLSFVPDFRFAASNLNGWHPLGNADWRAEKGEITAAAKPGKSGWLLLDRSFQDVGFHALFKCAPGVEAGVLFRAEKTDSGMQGVLVAIKDETAAAYRVIIGTNGEELQRTPLRYAGSIVRLALPPKPESSNNNNNQPGRRPPAAGPALPFTRPETALKPNEWNQVEVMLDADIIRTFLNDGRELGAATDELNGYGPVALYAGGGTVQYKEIGVKDIAVRVLPEEKSSERFRVQRINDMYYSWGAAAADFNRDGYTDIAAGLNIFYGPDYTTSREINPALTYNPSKEFTDINCQYTFDFNGDGWPDILSGTPRAAIYINPKGASRRWEKFEIIPSVQTEVTLFQDIDGDGKPALIYGADGFVRYATPDPADPTKPWIAHNISEKGYAMGHGIGAGDINGDGRTDIINAYGWWEQPAASGQPWTYHAAVLGRYGHRATGAGGAVMAVYDVNGDHLNDVVTSLNAHGFGLAWFEQQRDAAGNISFVMHLISDDFAAKNAGDVAISEIHGTAVADIDGDGIPDFVAGKRYWSHLDNHFDPDPYGAPVVYVYKTVRNPKAPGGAEFVPELVHNRSGAGSDILVTDLDKDGAIDIITSTDRGTFIFWNKSRKH